MPDLRVLVIDDEPAIARALRPALQGHGFAVATADTGRAGISQLESFTPDSDPAGPGVTRPGWSRSGG